MMRLKSSSIVFACAALSCSMLAFTETAPDFDGNRAASAGLPLPDAHGIGKSFSPQQGKELPSRDMDWRNDSAAFRSAKIDETIYSGRNKARAPIVIDESEFKAKLEEFSGARDVVIGGQTLRIPERGGEEGRKLARAWLAQEYQKIGFRTSVQEFDGGFYKGANFIAEKQGTSGKTIIISAHLDSVHNAGADDDGSGTVAALLVAKALKDANNKNTLRILGFDLEEKGLVGSGAYARTLDRNQIMGDIQMDMISFNSKKDGHFHVIDCDREESKFITVKLMAAIQSLGLPLTRVDACTDRSDHAAFWENGMPAVALSENFFGGDADVCYHQSCDVADGRLDFKYASNIAAAVANALLPLLDAGS